jgi:hypothetical protein
MVTRSRVVLRTPWSKHLKLQSKRLKALLPGVIRYTIISGDFAACSKSERKRLWLWKCLLKLELAMLDQESLFLNL